MQPGATRTRPSWSSLPEGLRTSITAAIGGAHLDDLPAHGGFSAGYAGVVRTSTGRAFVKAVASGGHGDSLALYRQEAALLPLIPAALAPRVIDVIDDDTGFALVIEAVDGTHPKSTWGADALRAVAHTMQLLAATEAPPGVPDAAEGTIQDLARWQHIADDPRLRERLPHGLARRLPELVTIEQDLAAAASGRMLIHGDLRADNILLRRDSARFVDWPSAVRGAAWFDLPCLLPSVEAGGGPRCEDAWSVFQEFGAPSPREHLPLIAGIASYFWFAQAQPEPAALPGLREFQRAQAVTALRWLSTLL